jgi:tetratricopeptide (TPR) repeat protein
MHRPIASPDCIARDFRQDAPMLDGVPAQIWLLIGIAAAMVPGAAYLYRYIVHSPRYRDITLAPEDLSWRTRPLLLRNALLLAVLGALAVFIFTPDAERLASSADFPTVLMAGIGVLAGWATFRGFRTGTAVPLVKGLSSRFDRDAQPRLYWASMAWNAAMSCLLLSFAFVLAGTQAERSCDGSLQDKDGQDSDWQNRDRQDWDRQIRDWQETVAACDALIAGDAGILQRWGVPLAMARSAPDEADLADYYGDRGRAHYMLGNYQAAVADHGRAIDRDPADSYALYNRGLAYGRMGEHRKAIEDFSASLELRPGNADGYLERGLARMTVGDMPAAIKDFTRLHALDPDNVWALANRGIGRAWIEDTAGAKADFAWVEARDPQNPVLLRGRALLAEKAGDPDGAIAFLTKALEVDPEDEWSLRRRADLYWDQGQEDLARADDDVINAIAY